MGFSVEAGGVEPPLGSSPVPACGTVPPPRRSSNGAKRGDHPPKGCALSFGPFCFLLRGGGRARMQTKPLNIAFPAVLGFRGWAALTRPAPTFLLKHPFKHRFCHCHPLIVQRIAAS